MAKFFEKAITFIVVFAAVVMAEDYDVGGDDNGWRRPTDPEFYNKWVAGKSFRVGDILEFEFAQGMHEVALVNKEAYENCNTENPLDLFQNSPVQITLNTTGSYYFLCPLDDHCMVGQKLAVTVTGASGGHGGAASTPAPVSAPTTPSAATPAAPTNPSAATPAVPTNPSAATPAAPTTPIAATPSVPTNPSVATPPAPTKPSVATPAAPTKHSAASPSVPTTPSATTPEASTPNSSSGNTAGETLPSSSASSIAHVGFLAAAMSFAVALLN